MLANQVFILKHTLEISTFPNDQGQVQERSLVRLNTDYLVLTKPQVEMRPRVASYSALTV